jgi:CO/xanthine dehydrogenase FAD-binding subunit
MSSTYVAATTIDEAVTALASGARAVAGGTDLVVGARQGKAPLPDSLVAIHQIEALRGIGMDNGVLRIGALASHEDVELHPLVRERFTGLADASGIVGSHATRHVGTLGGNVMNGSPAMETGGPLICLSAQAVLASTRGERRVAVEELFTGPGKTSAETDELLTAIEVPEPAPVTGSCYVRLEYRRQMEIAIVGASCAVTLDGGRVSTARVAITALAPTIHRVPDAEAALAGSDGSDAAIEAAAAAAAAASRPISDVRGSETYRRAMAAVITKRAVRAALARARGEHVPIPASPALHAAT